MTLRQLFRGFPPLATTRGKFPPPQRPNDRRARLRIEPLECRTLLSYNYTLIAETGGAIRDLPPTFPELNDHGVVSFRAILDGGQQAVYTGDGHGLNLIATTGERFSILGGVPFLNNLGQVAFTATQTSGGNGAFRSDGATITEIATTGPVFSSVVPSGTTINDAGTVTFQANLRSGGQAILTGQGGPPNLLYVTGRRYTGFQVPAMINNAGVVAFGADLPDGNREIVAGTGGPLTTIASTLDDSPFRALNRLLSVNDTGTVAFSADLWSGGQAILTGTGGPTQLLAVTGGAFESLPGGISINNSGTVAFGAQLTGGGQGIFTGPDPVADKVIATGDEVFGSSVAELETIILAVRGLNNAGQVAFRAMLADGRIVIGRADPDAGTAHGSRGKVVAPPEALRDIAVVAATWRAPRGVSSTVAATQTPEFPWTRMTDPDTAESTGQSRPMVATELPPGRPERLDRAFIDFGGVLETDPLATRLAFLV